MAETPLLRIKNLKKYFPIRGGLFSREVARVHAVDDVSFEILRGETLGLVANARAMPMRWRWPPLNSCG